MGKKKSNSGRNSMTSKNTNRQRKTDRPAMIADLFRSFPNKRYSIRNLAAASGGANRDGRRQTVQVVEQMLEQGTIESVGSGKYMFNPKGLPPQEGVVDMLASGSVYIKVEDQEQDVFVDSRNAGHAMHGDKVEFVITHIARNGIPEGKITKIIERSRKSYVGVLDLDPKQNFAFVRIDSRKVPMDVYVQIKDDQHVQDKDKVLVKIIDWADGSRSPVGEIVDIFGPAGNNNAEMHAILAEYDLPYRFSEEVSEAANRIPGAITDKDYAERRDMRMAPTLTIDPADAKDFDDALSVRKLKSGSWEIGIHIADVTHYVKPGSIVDTEAENRGTSVYLVDRTVPMLPERLSNILCSLRPGEEKLAFSAIFEMDENANIQQQWLGRTVIMSDRRYTYQEAQAIIEGGEGEFKEEILELNRLAQIMRSQRFNQGAITFEREEAKFKLDNNGKPLGVFFQEMKESNHLIEEFMLLANRRVAEFVDGKSGGGRGASKGKERTFVYRVHDEPNADKLASFKSFIMRFGYDFKADSGVAVSREMNRVMSEIKGKHEENVISTLAIRTMAKAFYTTENIGHYGLAFEDYTHFTSPIRRYPDMMVHRLLANYLAGGKSPDKDEFEKLCEHASDMEVVASEAERASIKYKMVEYMLDQVGNEFDGHISGVTEWGIYVELDDTHIEGMVSLRDLADDFYVFNEEDYAIVGRSTNRKFTLGDAVRIKILRADLARKQLDFEMVASYDFKSGKAIPVTEQHHQLNDDNRRGDRGGRNRQKSTRKRSRK